jgi:predicted transcriptional regulator
MFNYEYKWFVCKFDNMATLTVEIDKERDLPVLQALLDRMGLEFEIDDDDDWGNLPEAAVDGIKAGLADGEAGRVHSHEYIMELMEKKINLLRAKKNE